MAVGPPDLLAVVEQSPWAAGVRDRTVGVDDLSDQLGGARPTKVFGAGSTVVV